MSSIDSTGSASSVHPFLKVGGDSPKEIAEEGSLSGRKVQVGTGTQIGASPSTKYESLSLEPRSLSARDVAVDDAPPDQALRHEARYKALPTMDQLIQKAGRPKDDIKFWCFGSRTKKMSTGYKAILKGLEDYHDALDRGGKGAKGRMKLLRGHLQSMQATNNAYLGKAGHSRNHNIEALGHQIRNEIRLLDRAIQQMSEGADWPDGVSLKDGLNFARQGVEIGDLRASMTRDLQDSGMTLENLQPYRDAGFTGSEARLLEDSGLGLQGGMKFREANLKVTADTLPGPLTSGNEIEFRELGSGAMNTVFEVTYNHQAGNNVGVFKPLPSIDAQKVEHGWVSGKIGVNNRNPQTAMRNLGTVAVARELGFNVVPDTKVAEHGGQLGLLMDKAEGNLGRHTAQATFRDPDVRREITKLQLLDALVGQGDRHSSNYFVHKDSNTQAVTVTGIDNDQCFGSLLRDPNGIAYENTEQSHGFRGVKLPQVVDTDIAQQLRALTPEKLDELLGDKLAPSEIGATKDRLAAIKVHLDNLQQSGQIIAPDEWGEDQTAQLLSDRSSSYVGRDIARAPRHAVDSEQIRRQELLDQMMMSL
jgi:hypothetical protein